MYRQQDDPGSHGPTEAKNGHAALGLLAIAHLSMVSQGVKTTPYCSRKRAYSLR